MNEQININLSFVNDGKSIAEINDLVSEYLIRFKELNKFSYQITFNQSKPKFNKPIRQYLIEDFWELYITNLLPTEFIHEGIENKISNPYSSARVKLFRENSSCVACGLKINKVWLELPNDVKVAHYNFYGEENGEDILFTKDHIKPKSKGGQNNSSNYVTMCSTCNNLKGNNELTFEDVKYIRDNFHKKKNNGTQHMRNWILQEKTKRETIKKVRDCLDSILSRS